MKSEIEVNRALLLAIQTRSGLPEDVLTKHVTDEFQKLHVPNAAAVERLIRALGARNDVWLAGPEDPQS